MTWAKTWTPPPKLRDLDREPQRLSRVPDFGGSVSGVAVEKTEPKRNRALLDMAKDRPCLLLAVAHCGTTRGLSTVACHQNEGKGIGQKQSDERSVWGCAACHEWLDRSGSPRAEKRRAFMAAHLRQVLEWRRIATDQQEPERFRNAARWALEQLNATPIGETNA